MKCQKCGAVISVGNLYCDVCGAEYRVVPDYEPELEISIRESISGLTEESPSEEKKRKPAYGKAVALCLLLLLMGIGIGINIYSDTAVGEAMMVGKQTHPLRAVYKNAQDLSGRIREWKEEITTALSPIPVVWPESGTYEQAEFITVDVPEGVQIYYTMDGTIPTRESTLYHEPIPMPLGESRFAFIAFSPQGFEGELIGREYLLNIKTGITREEAENILIQENIKKGLILDKNGALADYYGVNRYFYRYPLLIEDNHYFIFAEHYLENEINRRTGNYYAVEVMTGECFRLIVEGDEGYSLKEI
ncbi:MAG: chitobiase/beta-hexosaminidase C-terminal domain-containing protein [Lachnospiraceae bacterium]